MKKQPEILILLLMIIFWTSCRNDSKRITKDIPVDSISKKHIIKIDTVRFTDTTIALKERIFSKHNNIHLTDSLAKQILYNYFRIKGYLISGELSAIQETDLNKTCVSYDTIYYANFTKSRNSDAIINYWLTPPYAAGHCWQPHKAIIVNTSNGYKLTNEEFIPVNFSIDSVLTKNEQTILYCYDYDCGDHKVLKKYRVRLNYKSG